MFKNTISLSASVAVVAALMLSVFAFNPPQAAAAVNVDNIIFSQNLPFGAGSTVNADLYLTSDGNNDIESISYRYTNATGIDAQWRCYDVNPNQTQASPLGGWIVDANLLVPSSGGLFTLEIGSHGTDGDGEDNQCLTSADDTTTFSNRVEVSGSTSSTSGTSGGNSSNTGGSSIFQMQIDALTASLKTLTEAVAKIVAGNAGGNTTKPSCPPAGDAWVVQTWLFANGYANHFTSKGVYAPTGFYGPITVGAVSAAQLACK